MLEKIPQDSNMEAKMELAKAMRDAMSERMVIEDKIEDIIMNPEKHGTDAEREVLLADLEAQFRVAYQKSEDATNAWVEGWNK